MVVFLFSAKHGDRPRYSILLEFRKQKQPPVSYIPFKQYSEFSLADANYIFRNTKSGKQNASKFCILLVILQNQKKNHFQEEEWPESTLVDIAFMIISKCLILSMNVNGMRTSVTSLPPAHTMWEARAAVGYGYSSEDCIRKVRGLVMTTQLQTCTSNNNHD